MPYKNIQFVKVKMELLEDHRFLYDLNDAQKGFYLLLLALAGKTNNKIANNLTFINGRLNINGITNTDLERISEVYPKFHLVGGYWQFDNFDNEHNQILSKHVGISQEYPADSQRIDKKRIDKKRIEKNSTVSNEEFLEQLKQNPAYAHINLPLELGKMDAWLASHTGRKKTRRFIVAWLNRIDAPIPNEPKKDPYATLRKIVQ